MSTRYSTVYCDDCKHEFSMNAVDIKQAAVTLGGQALVLVYFTCPKCNKIYRITLKDERYDALRLDLEKTKKRIRKNHGSGNGEFASTLDTMVRRKLERLRTYTTELNGKYPGTFVFAVSENSEGEIIKYLP